MGKNWAIAIGINEYDNLKPLKYAERDAEAVRDFFRDEIKFDRIYHLRWVRRRFRQAQVRRFDRSRRMVR